MILFFKVFFSVVCLMSLLREVRKFDFVWNRLPLFMQFIPTWSFFAPVPNMFDYNLLYREISNSGEVDEWKEAYNLKDNRPRHSLFWNPEKRMSKAFLDVALDLLRFSDKIKSKEQISISIPYLHILNYVDFLCKNGDKLQFMILTNSIEHDYKVAFLSDVHPVSRR